MNSATRLSQTTLCLLLLLAATRLYAQAGPPFQTDDPTPVDLGHYEAYIFSTVDGTPVEIDPTGPAFEFNWGAIPNIQLHAILPFGAILPSNNPVYLPAGTGPSAFGLTDMELGIKYGFIKQTTHRPQIGSFTMFEIPTGSYSQGLGVGKVWYKLPLWAEKEFGPWSLVGGLGYTVVPQTDYSNFLYGGLLVKRVLESRLVDHGLGLRRTIFLVDVPVLGLVDVGVLLGQDLGVGQGLDGGVVVVLMFLLLDDLLRARLVFSLDVGV